MFWRLILRSVNVLAFHMFKENFIGLNPFSQENKQENVITFFVTLAVLGSFISGISLLPLFIGLKKSMYITFFWTIQEELLAKLVSIIGFFSILRWDKFTEQMSRISLFQSILSNLNITIASFFAQLYFIITLSFSLILSSSLIFSLFISPILKKNVFLFFIEYTLFFLLIPSIMYVLVNSINIVSSYFRLYFIKYMLLIYFTVILIAPFQLIKNISIASIFNIIPFFEQLIPSLKEIILNNNVNYIFIYMALLLLMMTCMILLLKYLFINQSNAKSHNNKRGLSTNIFFLLTKCITLKDSTSRALMINSLTNLLYHKQIRSIFLILFSAVFGCIFAETLTTIVWLKMPTKEAILKYTMHYFFIALFLLSGVFYYISRLPLSKAYAWNFKLHNQHHLYWNNKSVVFKLLFFLCVVFIIFYSTAFLILTVINFGLNCFLIGTTLWGILSLFQGGYAWYIPFISIIETDSLMFKRLWLLYFIGLYYISMALKQIQISIHTISIILFCLLIFLKYFLFTSFIKQKIKQIDQLYSPNYEEYNESMAEIFEVH